MNRSNLLILFTLALLSALIAERLIASLLPSLPLASIPLTGLLFLVLFLLFDRYLWRWFAPGSQPAFHGEWFGRLNTSRTESSEIEKIRVRIYQHWLTSRVDFFAPHSSSRSLAAVFYPDKNGQTVLAYIYRSKPYKGKENIVPAHVGLNIFYFTEKAQLTGYFHHLEADEQGVKLTHGQMILSRSAVLEQTV